ncbi:MULTISPECIES: right-handed parallel beta-helix repeat-containing protein [unclassified Streptomyces]|uniref:right-handed parallel beta-helix repeat-containing protein n=1 Tax=unclassified Streptomyces TaxID=2593676 RepID=UPI00225BD9E0|nr:MULTISPECIES: right-handed parallel beta-helix repeat-containing protein [unclassified Streptomyces]WSP58642.1 right-handed parallel beta-helix repeat-containing protein [Streptomyces sp. NBC_01241]WSU20780.1 right-handed parallel beta-helix repeat-containing protein [Streptomyces sp. NBC_01108]MCX4790418.1 right-handed parallel beta-helix repeat-containing protein [Streptomyces sp. NBC_01221]MCX4793854.1 right-handed parallel beta-helix repeat-containing protein [Streptomyces sp. NBC_01242]
MLARTAVSVAVFRAALRLSVLVVSAAMAATGCSGTGSTSADARHPAGSVLRVPQDFRSVQQAVDVAREGETVLVGPGVYRESVRVTKSRVVLRGTDRNAVVFDGGVRLANGITVTGAGSVVENLTVHGYLANGVLFTGVTDERLQQRGAGGSAYDPLDTTRFPAVQGFRATRVTAYNNGLYGIYAFDARDGVIEDSYASGHADSGIYVGQCKPCDTVVRGNTVERNAVGIELTNASDGLSVLGNRVAHNRVGVTVNSNDLEALAPQHGAVIAGNVVADNNAADTPEQADGGFGIGIGIGGGTGNRVQRNLVRGNRAAGVVVTDPAGHPASGNRVEGNRATGNGTDLVLASADPSNCFADNRPAIQSPDGLEGRAGCGTRRGALPSGRTAVVQAPPGVPFSQVPAPPAQPSMPDPTAPGSPATNLPGAVDAAAYPLPKEADAVPRSR